MEEGSKSPNTYKDVGIRKDSLTAEDGLCEFLSSSLISLAVRLFLWMFIKRGG